MLRVSDMAEVIGALLPLGFEPHESQTIKDAALAERARLALRIARAVLAHLEEHAA